MKILNSYPLINIPVLFDDHVYDIQIVHSANCLFVLMLYVPINNFWSCLDDWLSQYFAEDKLEQNALPPFIPPLPTLA